MSEIYYLLFLLIIAAAVHGKKNRFTFVTSIVILCGIFAYVLACWADIKGTYIININNIMQGTKSAHILAHPFTLLFSCIAGFIYLLTGKKN